MTENVQRFLDLVKENPDLPIVCMTDYDVVYDGSCRRWLSEIGGCYVGEYACYNDQYYNDREDFKEQYYNMNDEYLDKKFGYFIMWDDEHYTDRQKKEHDDAEKALESYLNSVAEEAFRRAIIVNIDYPSSEIFKEFTRYEGPDGKIDYSLSKDESMEDMCYCTASCSVECARKKPPKGICTMSDLSVVCSQYKEEE